MRSVEAEAVRWRSPAFQRQQSIRFILHPLAVLSDINIALFYDAQCSIQLPILAGSPLLPNACACAPVLGLSAASDVDGSAVSLTQDLIRRPPIQMPSPLLSRDPRRVADYAASTATSAFWGHSDCRHRVTSPRPRPNSMRYFEAWSTAPAFFHVLSPLVRIVRPILSTITTLALNLCWLHALLPKSVAMA